MTRQARRVVDPYNGRHVIDWAYSLGCLHVLGDTDADKILDAIVKECAKNRAAQHGLIEQYRMGQRHERQRGQT